VKFRLQPMLGVQRFYDARRVITAVELAPKIHKGQFAVPAAFVRLLRPSDLCTGLRYLGFNQSWSSRPQGSHVASGYGSFDNPLHLFWRARLK